MKKKFSAAFLTLFLMLTLGMLVHASSVTMNKNSATIQIGETVQLQALVNGTAKTAYWGSSDTSVATVSSTGLVTGKAAGSSVITAMVNGTSVECVVSVVKKTTTENARYNVLILDTSKSMKGTPLKRVKEAAKRFSKTVINSAGKNYLAIVTFNTSAKTICSFTDNLTTLNNSINRISASGNTNLNAALKKAGNLLAATPSGKNVMKNIIICSDGLPQSGTKSTSGRYKKSTHKNYAYANAAYKTDVALKNKGYFVYALGFFHNSEGDDLTFGKKLMKDLASKDKYFIVTEPDDVDNVFKNIAADINDVTINKSSITLYVGDTYKLTTKVDGKTKTAKWKSSKKSVATVNSSGKVTAKKVGTATITGTVSGQSVTCKVTVKKKNIAASIRLNKSSASVYVGKKITLKATVTGNSKKVTWKTSNKKVATVKNGVVTGKSYGTVTISATANGKTAKCKVKVLVKHPEYSQYFMIKPTKSNYGDATINEYGVRLKVNEGAVIKKCAVYIEKDGSQVKRTIACVGDNITYATYVPYLAYNGKTKYDGDTSYSIRTFTLRKNYENIWSVYSGGYYAMITANLEDSNGKELAVKSTGVAGKNTKIFYDKDKMIAWLKK